jgi:hypothetical protein
MGKLKEKMLNNMTEQEMEDNYGISAFEYVELMSKYKESVEEEYIPTDEELQKLDAMLEDYYNSKEFRDYVENYQPGESLQELEDDFFGKWTSEDIDAALAQHNAHEEGFDLEDGWTEEMEKRYWEEQPPYPFATEADLEAINESIKLKYTDSDILDVLYDYVDASKVDVIMDKLNEIWNNKNGLN